MRERRATPYDGQGMREPPVVPVELRPLPVASATGKAGRGSGKPLKDGVAHNAIIHFNDELTGPVGFEPTAYGCLPFRG